MKRAVSSIEANRERGSEFELSDEEIVCMGLILISSLAIIMGSTQLACGIVAILTGILIWQKILEWKHR